MSSWHISQNHDSFAFGIRVFLLLSGMLLGLLFWLLEVKQLKLAFFVQVNNFFCKKIPRLLIAGFSVRNSRFSSWNNFLKVYFFERYLFCVALEFVICWRNFIEKISSRIAVSIRSSSLSEKKLALKLILKKN